MGIKGQMITNAGETKTVSEWAQLTGLPAQTIYKRLAAGLPVDRVLDAKRQPVGRPRTKRMPVKAKPRFQSDALNMIYEDMKAQQRTLYRNIRAFVRTIEDQAAGQRLTLERILEERTAPPADLGRGVVFNFDDELSDRLFSTAQDRG
jgi:hypothetical protein